MAVSSDAGCLGALVAVAAVSLILTLSMFWPTGSVGLYIPVFAVTTIVFVAIGFPLYLAVRHFRRENLWTALACGAATGAALPLVSALADGSPGAWRGAAGYALAGVIGGLVFFLTATASRSPARNIAILFAVVGISAALAPPVAALLS
jgi:hypothetical protein